MPLKQGQTDVYTLDAYDSKMGNGQHKPNRCLHSGKSKRLQDETSVVVKALL